MHEASVEFVASGGESCRRWPTLRDLTLEGVLKLWLYSTSWSVCRVGLSWWNAVRVVVSEGEGGQVGGELDSTDPREEEPSKHRNSTFQVVTQHSWKHCRPQRPYKPRGVAWKRVARTDFTPQLPNGGGCLIKSTSRSGRNLNSVISQFKFGARRLRPVPRAIMVPVLRLLPADPHDGWNPLPLGSGNEEGDHCLFSMELQRSTME